MKKVVLLITLLILLLSVEVCAIEGRTVALDIGVGFGPKFSLLGIFFSFKYFVVDNLALELYGGGFPTVPVLFWGTEINYYPSFFNDYSYFNLGISHGRGGRHNYHTYEEEGPKEEFSSNFWVFNTGIGVNTKKFAGYIFLPEMNMIEQSPVDLYIELGLSRFLDVDVKKTINDEEVPLDTNDMSEYQSGDWFFPNIEVGVRRGGRWERQD